MKNYVKKLILFVLCLGALDTACFAFQAENFAKVVRFGRLTQDICMTVKRLNLQQPRESQYAFTENPRYITSWDRTVNTILLGTHIKNGSDIISKILTPYGTVQLSSDIFDSHHIETFTGNDMRKALKYFSQQIIESISRSLSVTDVTSKVEIQAFTPYPHTIGQKLVKHDEMYHTGPGYRHDSDFIHGYGKLLLISDKSFMSPKVEIYRAVPGFFSEEDYKILEMLGIVDTNGVILLPKKSPDEAAM